ncbi:MAG: hypothetical protein PHV37_01945 [Candidatus Gastranaerophilales bacterium]|nr:hypothetical protein [Candidatus Gastranaerophilales bacterium]
MENTEDKEKNRTYNLGCLLIGIPLLIILFFLLSYQPKPLTKEEINQINKEKLQSINKFETLIKQAGNSCDNAYVISLKSIKNGDYVTAYDKLNNTHYSCLAAQNEISKIKIPDIDSNYQDILKESKNDFAISYASKANACKAYKKAIDKNSIDAVNSASEKSTLATEFRTRGIDKIKNVKNDIESKLK